MQSTFDLAMPNPPPPNPPRFPYTDAHIKKLAERYYETNDWFCSAFGELLKLAVRETGEKDSRWFEAVCAEEKRIRDCTGRRSNRSAGRRAAR
ncbi:MAG: hypothetical protein FJ398_12655 [Verrucomicrobia bacterium]|nr:hypothetical protein [Verrucomicrobiota bacterium]